MKVPSTARPDAGGAGSSPSLAEQAYDSLKAELFDLALLPGDAFTEQALVDVLGMSRTPVRQALQRLAREGLVQLSSRKGWQVRPFDFARFEHLYDLRIVLELAAVARLCLAPTSAQSETLRHLAQVWGAGPDDRLPPGRDAALLDEAFHCGLVAAAGNPEMAAVHRDVTQKISLVRRLDFTQPSRVDATYEEHAAIVQRLLARQQEAACSLLRAHIDSSKAEVRKITLHSLHAARSRRFGEGSRRTAVVQR